MLMTLVFPDSLSNTFPRNAPVAGEISIPSNSSVKTLPTTWNPLSPISQDTALAFAVPSDEAPGFLASIQELPNIAATQETSGEDAGDTPVDRRSWVMKAAKNGHPSRGTLRHSAASAWVGFVDLVKVSWRVLFPAGMVLKKRRMRSRSTLLLWFWVISLCI